MKRFIFLIFCLGLTEFIFADESPGKPGAPVAFVDNRIILLQPGVPELVQLQLISSVDELQYSLQTTEGLIAKIVDNPAYVTSEVLTITVELLIQNPGRYYLHLYAKTNDQDGEKTSVISRIISGEQYPGARLSLNKPQSVEKIILLPSTEKVRAKSHE